MSIKNLYCGVIVPMLSPLSADGEIDEIAVRKLTQHVSSNGCAPFILGTTGEASSLTDKQKAIIVETTVKAVKGDAIIYAGISDNSLQSSIDKATLYKSLGARAAVAHLPCYYDIDENQMRRWYLSLADKSPLPVMLYNIPVTTGLSMSLELVDELSYHENIVGFKDSQRGEERLDKSIDLWREREDFTFHLGWAAMSTYGLLNGVDGIIPSSANLVPELYNKLYVAAKAGKADLAYTFQKIGDEISAYYQQDKKLAQSIPIFKAMMQSFDLCKAYAFPPMLTLSSSDLMQVDNDMQNDFKKYVS